MLLITKLDNTKHMFTILEHLKPSIALNKRVESIFLCLFAKLQVAQVEVADGFKYTAPYSIVLLSEYTAFP